MQRNLENKGCPIQLTQSSVIMSISRFLTLAESRRFCRTNSHIPAIPLIHEQKLELNDKINKKEEQLKKLRSEEEAARGAPVFDARILAEGYMAGQTLGFLGGLGVLSYSLLRSDPGRSDPDSYTPPPCENAAKACLSIELAAAVLTTARILNNYHKKCMPTKKIRAIERSLENDRRLFSHPPRSIKQIREDLKPPCDTSPKK